MILFYDPDEQVRRYAGECFAYLATEPLETFRPLIEQFIESPALREGSVHLVKYLAPLATELPDFAMQVAEKIVELFGRNITDIQHAEMVLEKDLARLPLTIYNYVDDLTIKSRAMDLFDCLLLLGSHTAQQALQDWDRR